VGVLTEAYLHNYFLPQEVNWEFGAGCCTESLGEVFLFKMTQVAEKIG